VTVIQKTTTTSSGSGGSIGTVERLSCPFHGTATTKKRETVRQEMPTEALQRQQRNDTHHVEFLSFRNGQQQEEDRARLLFGFGMCSIGWQEPASNASWLSTKIFLESLGKE